MRTPVIKVISLTSFWGRLRGLLGRAPPGPQEGVWIAPCRQVHTLGMSYPIDVIYLDRNGQVLAAKTLRPWRIGRFQPGAAGVLELRAGEAKRLGIGRGVTVRLIEADTSC